MITFPRLNRLFAPALVLLLVAGNLLSPTVRAESPKPHQPNVLFVLTDDQRYDSIRAFNRIQHGREHSELGYIESPNIDRLAAEGTVFINTYCHAQGCAPSRATMHYGRYAHHTGIYEFEYHNNTLPHWKPSLPEAMKSAGYQTFHVGKLGVRIRTIRNGRTAPFSIYETDISFHKMWAEGLSDWNKGKISEVNGRKLDEPVHCDWLFSPDGVEYTGSGLNAIPGLEDHSRRIDEKYDLLRLYPPGTPKVYGAPGIILGGVSPQPAWKTRDGRYTTELIRYLKNPGKMLTIGSQTYQGVDPSRPVFAHIGYDFPHTPVLPPKSFRDRFRNHTYKIPTVDESEFDKLPPQLQKLVRQKYSDHFTDDEKQQMVRDYFAFCAYGDMLVGEAVDTFIRYSEAHHQPWMIVYVCGDHGWKLNEHGAISKFSPWHIDSHNPIIVVSSDKQAFPPGRVVTDFTEFVDIMPTILAAAGVDLSDETYSFLDGYDLAKVVSGELPPRPYVIGELHAVTGPRATIRTKDYMFSLKPRPNRNRGENMLWAMHASYEELEPVLYDLRKDPHELNNVAFDESYRPISEALKTKLLNIVLGDRVEVDWEQWGTGTRYFTSRFAPDADDKQLSLPEIE